MEINNITRTFYRFLNEGKAESFRDAYYPEIDDYILNKIIEIDPESNGDDVSEWGKLLMKLNPTQSDIEQAGKDIAIIAKAAELGKDIPALNTIETMEDLHYLAVDVENEKGHMTDDEINSQEESLNCPIAFDDGGFRVIEINSPEAAEFYGKGSRWPWSLPSTDGNMFEILSQRGSIYVVKNEIDNTIFSLMKLGNRIRITDYNDEPVNKNMFPQELISTIMNVNESVTKFIKEKNHRIMNENIVKNIISALNENYSRRNIKGSELKNAMNEVCECITKKSDINTVVKGKLKTVVESYNKKGKKITTEDYTKVLNLVKESFTKKRNSTVLKENKNTLNEYSYDVNMNYGNGYAPELVMNGFDFLMDALGEDIMEAKFGEDFVNFPDILDELNFEVEDEIDYNDSVSYNVYFPEWQDDILLQFFSPKEVDELNDYLRKNFDPWKYSDYLSENVQKNNTTVLKENELHSLLMEAVRKNVQRINEEFDEEYGEDPAWWEYGYEPGREGEMEHDFTERDNFERMRINKQHREMDALANQRRNDQYFPEEENDDVRRWINGENVFESRKRMLNESSLVHFTGLHGYQVGWNYIYTDGILSINEDWIDIFNYYGNKESYNAFIKKYQGNKSDDEFLDSIYECIGEEIVIDCYCEFQPGEEQSWDSPGYPDSFNCYRCEINTEDETIQLLRKNFGDEFTEDFIKLGNEYFESRIDVYGEWAREYEYCYWDNAPDEDYFSRD